MDEPNRETTAGPSREPQAANGLAIASVIQGALSLVCCGFLRPSPASFLGTWPPPATDKPTEKISAVTIVGLITSYAGLALSILSIVIMVLLFEPLLAAFQEIMQRTR